MRGAKQKKFEISDLRREILHLRSVCLFPAPHVGLGYFGGFKILNLNYFGVFRKLNIFGGMKILWIFLGVITKLDYTMHFRVFSEGQGTKWRIFFGLLKFQIFIWGA